jgi:hypothetical protein
LPITLIPDRGNLGKYLGKMAKWPENYQSLTDIPKYSFVTWTIIHYKIFVKNWSFFGRLMSSCIKNCVPKFPIWEGLYILCDFLMPTLNAVSALVNANENFTPFVSGNWAAMVPVEHFDAGMWDSICRLMFHIIYKI